MFKKILISLSLILLLLFASVGADTIIKNLQVTTMPVNFYFDGKQAIEQNPGTYYNGKANVPLALFYEGTTYVPIRYAGEKLGKEVGWDQNSRSVWVGTKPTSFSTSITNTSSDTSIFGIFIGQSDLEVTKLLGTPNRKDKSALGYEWWIYNKDLGKYIQIGVKNNKVVDIYTNSTNLAFAKGLKIGSTKEQLNKAYPLASTVSLTYDRADFKITNDLNERALTVINGIPYIFYIDLHDQNKITAIRSMSVENLLIAGLYNMKFSFYGTQPNITAPKLSDQDQKLVEQAYEKQIFDLTNSIRLRNNLPTLTWNEDAAQVARSHSAEMLANNYFSHVSPITGYDPFDRLKNYGVRFSFAGENIAKGHIDGIEAHEAWMNSMIGHRDAILEKDFKTLGVGVKQNYYTQNFVTY